jgi:hypothetical protein
VLEFEAAGLPFTLFGGKKARRYRGKGGAPFAPFFALGRLLNA